MKYINLFDGVDLILNEFSYDILTDKDINSTALYKPLSTKQVLIDDETLLLMLDGHMLCILQQPIFIIENIKFFNQIKQVANYYSDNYAIKDKIYTHLTYLEKLRLNILKKIFNYIKSILKRLLKTPYMLPFFSPHGLDKYSCKMHAKLFGKLHDLKSIGLRFFNVYGSKQDLNFPYSGVISIFINQLLNGLPLTIFRGGKQEGDFIFVSDVVKALIMSAKFVSNEAKIYNICTGKGSSINKLAEILSKIVNKNTTIKYFPRNLEDIDRSVKKILDL